MGLLDSVIGVLSGLRSSSRGDVLTAVLRMLADDGGGGLGVVRLQERFVDAGLSDTWNSWVARGENLAISPDELQRALGSSALDDIARQQGMSQRAAADRLCQMLPYVLDQLTPDGCVPEQGLGDVGTLMGRMAALK
jgi:uncharacterized protein YidB (DUF937 family)